MATENNDYNLINAKNNFKLKHEKDVSSRIGKNVLSSIKEDIVSLRKDANEIISQFSSGKMSYSSTDVQMVLSSIYAQIDRLEVVKELRSKNPNQIKIDRKMDDLDSYSDSMYTDMQRRIDELQGIVNDQYSSEEDKKSAMEAINFYNTKLQAGNETKGFNPKQIVATYTLRAYQQELAFMRDEGGKKYLEDKIAALQAKYPNINNTSKADLSLSEVKANDKLSDISGNEISLNDLDQDKPVVAESKELLDNSRVSSLFSKLGVDMVVSNIKNRLMSFESVKNLVAFNRVKTSDIQYFLAELTKYEKTNMQDRQNNEK